MNVCRYYVVIVITVLLIITPPSLGSELGDVAAVIPNPHQKLVVSEPIKYVTRNGIEVSLNTLKGQMQKENEDEQSQSNLQNKPNRFRRKFKRKRLSCHMCSAPDCMDHGICDGAVSCFTSQLRDSEGLIQRSKGCTSKLDHHLMYCSTRKHDGKKIHSQLGRSSQYAFDCCKDHSLCNNATNWPELPPVPNTDLDTENPDASSGSRNSPSTVNNGTTSTKIAIAISVPVALFAVLVALIVLIMKGCHNKKMKNLKATLNQALGGGPWETNHNGEGELLDGIRFRPVGDSTLRAFGAEEDSLTSGSGSGMPQLVQRTLARQIHLGELIGKGRYGKVHKGTWNGDNYAVKIFLTKDEDSWKRETDIYSTVLLRHENILGYVGSDVTSLNSCTQLWLVTDYYHNGSLYDFLRDTSRPCLTTCQAYGILASCLSGLVHLHQEIFGTKTQDQHNYKPAIAHRDIKSKNILVREDGFTCVIADFGLAVTYNSSEGDMDVMHNYRVGTKRYMSPEILDGSIENNKTFESYKRADVYALALVMWEVLKRTQIHTSGVDEESNLQILGTDQPLFSRESNDYALPYHLDVAPDPTFDEMKKVVCLDKKRPNLPLHWTSGKNSFFAGLTNIMKECWHEKPDVRHSMLRIKKNLNELQRYAIELDTHETGSSSCYFSLYGPHRPNRTSSCNVSPHRNEDSAIGYNMNPRRAQYDTYNENQPAIARGLGFSRHSITGGGSSRAVGDSGGTAGSGSVNSTITQTSYCSSGYQSKLGSQSGSVDQSGVAGNDGSAIFTPEYQRILPTSTNATHSHVHRNESQESTIALGTIAQVSNSINSQLSRTGAAHIPQFRNVVSRSQIHGPPIQDPMLDENEEDGAQS